MRQKINLQTTIWELYPDHPFAHQLQAISRRLDQHPRFRDWVAEDLGLNLNQDTGRQGLSVDSTIRCGLLKTLTESSYEELAIMLQDSMASIAFSRIDTTAPPSTSALQANIGQIPASTWEKINRCLIRQAKYDGMEKGRLVRTDATVMQADIHHPTDNSLLADGIRVMTRHLKYADEYLEVLLPPFRDHNRASKKLARLLETLGSKGQKGKQTYRRLITYCQKTRSYLVAATAVTSNSFCPRVYRWYEQAKMLIGLVDRVIDQTERRVFRGEKVPASEKLLSLFEPHTDVIVKAPREVQYGHKINLTTGRSGLVLDMVVEEGNPADSQHVVPMIERQVEIYGCPPRQAAFDGGYASTANLAEAKALGVKDVAFHKKRGLKVEMMTKSNWVYRKLRAFRAGIEGNISTLKRKYGWYRCNWKGWKRFQAYAWSAVVAYNLMTMARLELAAEA